MNTREVVFVDASVADAQEIIGSLPEHAEYVLLNPNQDGLDQIKIWALTHTDYDAIHVISHGADGMLQVGQTSLTESLLDQRAGDLDIIRSALAPDADLLIYGCNVAATEVGNSFLKKLSGMLDVDVAASTDLTGGPQGNEILEYALGEVQTQPLDLPELSVSLLDPADPPVITYTISATDAWGARGYATEFATILSDNSAAILFDSGKTLRVYNGSGTLSGTVDVNTLLTNGANGVLGLSNGNILVYGENLGSSQPASFAIVDKAGSTVLARTVVTYDTYDNNSFMSVAELSNGNLAVQWYNASGLNKVQIWGQNGSAVSGVISLGTAGSTNYDAHLAASKDGGFIAAYAVYNTPEHAVIYNNDGSVRVSDFNAGSYWNDGSARIYALGSGDYYLYQRSNAASFINPVSGAQTAAAYSPGYYDPIAIDLAATNGGFAQVIANSQYDAAQAAAVAHGLGFYETSGNNANLQIVKYNNSAVQSQSQTSDSNLYYHHSFNVTDWGGGFLYAYSDQSYAPSISAFSGDSRGYGTIAKVYTSDSANTVTVRLYNVTTAPTVTLSVNNASVAEASGSSTITATLSAVASADTIVSIGNKSGSTATLTSDFTLSSNTITILTGQTTGTATLTAVQDTLDEANETAIIEVTGVSGGGGATESGSQEATITIIDDDPTPSLSIANASLVEGNSGSSNMTFTVTLSAVSGRTVTVGYATSNDSTPSALAGTDYTATSGTLTFNPGETSKTFSVPVLGDVTQENNETFSVTLSSPTNATIGAATAVGTINDDENAAPTITELDGDSSTFIAGNSEYIDLQAGSGLVVADADSVDFNGGYLTITRTSGTADGSFLSDLNDAVVKFGATEAGAGDTPAGGYTVYVQNQGSGSYMAIGTVHATQTGLAGADLRIDFNTSGATPANVSEFLKFLKYTAPSAGARVFSTVVNDGDGASSTASSFTMTATVDSDSTVNASATVAEPVTLDTTKDTVGEAVNVFDFAVADAGTTDSLPTVLSQIALSTSGTGDFSKVTWQLSGGDIASPITGTYNSSTNKVTFSGLSESVENSSSQTYTVSAYYNNTSGLTEGQTYILSVDGDSTANFTVGANGSQMAPSQSAVTNNSGTTVNVLATELRFTTQPSAAVTSGSVFASQPVVKATDAFGNVDTDFVGSVTLTENGSGTLSDGDATVAQNATAGIATFSGVLYTAASDADANFALTAAASGLSNATSSSVNPDVLATKLIFSTQPGPSSLQSGQVTNFSTVPVVQAVDASNTVDTDYSAAIVLSATNTSGGAVAGTVNSLVGTGDTDGAGATVTLSPSSGAATFTGLALTYTNDARACSQ